MKNGTLGKALNKHAQTFSASPDDMKVMTDSPQGTSHRAPMPKPRRKLFTQRYWSRGATHPDYTQGDQAGVTSRKEATTGGRVR